MPAFRFEHPRYASAEVLGQGAQAVVLRVTDRESPGRPLVAKVFRPGAFDPEVLSGEFALLSRLHAPGLARAHDFGSDRGSGAPFLTEDFVDGPDATAWIGEAHEVRHRVERAADLLVGTASTLALLHDAGFVHGDLKAAHVRIPARGRPVLLDLGAAMLCSSRSERASGAVAFTRGYASPELLSGAEPGPRSDLYALGALVFRVLTGKFPEQRRDAPSIRALTPFVPPSLSDLVDQLTAIHPEDRPPDARSVLGTMGASFSADPSRLRAFRFQTSPSFLREPVLEALGTPRSGVRYLTGTPGSGKSHVLGELYTRALLSGRAARLLRFPFEGTEILAQLIRFFRTGAPPAPFVEQARSLFLILDDLHAAPAELTAAIEAFRCRPRDASTPDWDIVAGLREPPEGADVSVLAPLDVAETRLLLSELGEPEERAAEACAESGGNAGFVVAALGRVPLTRDAAISRTRNLSAGAKLLLAAIAVLKGHMQVWLARALLGEEADSAAAELHASALLSRTVTRTGDAAYSLSQPDLAEELAEALADFDVADRLANAVLSSEPEQAGRADARVLLAVADAPKPPDDRERILERAAERASEQGLRAEHVEALLALAANPKNRRRDVLLALDRTTRGGGSAGLHPELVAWLREGARTDPALRVLSLRRSAEQNARAGEISAARDLADRARAVADERGSRGERALALSTLASVALYSADFRGADEALRLASECLSEGSVEDDEELARIHHNRGVVALYRMRLAEARDAFEQSLAAKRAMGDRGGMWACLLNLGLALTKLGEHDRAERALGEATLLCKALGQRAGVSWCQVASADVAVRRKDRVEAERRIAEAEHFGEGLPESVRADLSLLRAEVALLSGSGEGALLQAKKVGEALRNGDAMLGARALVLEARAYLCSLPVDARRAARLSIQALRIARAAELPEPEAEATEALRRSLRARRKALVLAEPTPMKYSPVVTDGTSPWGIPGGGLWGYLDAVARGATRADAARLLTRAIASQSGAERVLVVALDGALAVTWAAGTDLDGLDLADPTSRIDRDTIVSASALDGVAYQRDIETRGGRGCRLVATKEIDGGARAAVVAEHRFASGAFDSVTRGVASEWAVLAAIALFRTPTASIGEDDGAQGRTERAIDEGSSKESSGGESATDSEPSTSIPRNRTRTFPEIAGTSDTLKRALDRLDAAIDSDLPVLVLGETGSGKELFARALHQHGRRSKGPFVAVNCGAIHDSLFEAELFGHAKGGFTGAERSRTGLIASAQHGVLFLDEIGDVPLARQVSLLRVLATHRYRPVGSDEERSFDVRIVAATNRDLEKEVEAGRFRKDLLYRLNVLEVLVPPLRKRQEDVVPLAKRFLEEQGSTSVLSAETARALEAYPWPGNVRELEHQMQRLAALGVGRVELRHLSREIRSVLRGAAAKKIRGAARSPIRLAESSPSGDDGERRQVQSALRAAQGNITHAASALSMTRQGLKKKMVRLGLRESGARAQGRSK